MEAIVLLSILGAGYLFNKSEVDSNNKDTEILDEKDIYKSHYFKESDIEYKKKVIDNYNKSKIPGSNIVNYQNIDEYLNRSTDSKSDIDNNDYDYVYSSSSGGKISKDEFLVNDQGIKVEPFFSGAGPRNINLNENRQLNIHQGNVNFKQKKN